MSLIFMALGRYVSPLFMSLGLAPIYLILHRLLITARFTTLIIQLIGCLCLTFIIWDLEYLIEDTFAMVDALCYGLLISATFVLYFITGRANPNRLGVFNMLIFWLAFEYLAIKINPEFSRFLLGVPFNSHPQWITWTQYTGFQGISLWVLVVNILLYFAFFKDESVFFGKIRWLTLIYSSAIAAIPLLLSISFGLVENTVTQAHVYELYLDDSTSHISYSESGEWLGRTSLWVTIFIILFAFVKKRIIK